MQRAQNCLLYPIFALSRPLSCLLCPLVLVYRDDIDRRKATFSGSLSLCVCIFFLPLLCHKYCYYIAISVEYFRGLVIFLPYCVRCIAIDVIEVYSISPRSCGASVYLCRFHCLSLLTLLCNYLQPFLLSIPR